MGVPCGRDVNRQSPLSQLQRSTQLQPLTRSSSLDQGSDTFSGNRTGAMDLLLDQLRHFDAIRTGTAGDDQLLAETVERVPPAEDDSHLLDTLHPAVVKRMRDRGIIGLYQYQAEVITKARRGANVVVQAPTASGKTLAFQIPLMERLVAEGGHALLIYPTKALGNDQRDQLRRMFGSMTDPNGTPIDSWWYDGDTDEETRRAIRSQPPHILITTPEMLHRSFLAHSQRWTGFLEQLRYIVVDEMHEYRGYFGSNMSLLLRRFSHHLASKSADAQFLLASATCANALEHAEALTGLSFEEVSAADQFRPRRTYYFVRPDIPEYRYWRILQLRAVNAGLASMAIGKSALVFCPTRNFAEECYQTAQRRVMQLREDGLAHLDMDAIRVFRGGLSSDERHEIQDGLREGSVRLAFTTNALELGIDIGGLDGVILAGFPDSMMSAWQRIGRAGRHWQSDAFVLYYARNNPLDQFYASNLRMFLQKPLDELVVNPGNEELVKRHLPCLLYETPDIEEGKAVLGDALYEAARGATERGARLIPGHPPHFRVDIRGAGGGVYTLKRGATEIGTLSAHQQFREAYQDAIYMHGGGTYRVESIELASGGGEVRLSDAPDHIRTNAHLITTTQTQELFDGRQWRPGVTVMHGNVTVTELLVAVREYDERTDETLNSWTPDSNNASYSNAHAFWLQTDGDHSAEGANGVAELQHLLRIGTLFTVPTEAHDVIPHAMPRDGVAYLIESHAGGIGIVRKVFERWREVLETGVRMAEDCECRSGCPNCIVPPRTREELDKRHGIALARRLLSVTDRPHDDESTDGLWEPVDHREAR